LITTGVQALAGLLLPSATVFLLLLCNDREVLGPWVNRLWLNVLASVIVSVLLLLSGILMATTMFPDLNVVSIAYALALVFVVCAAATSGVLWSAARRRKKQPMLVQLTPASVRVGRDSWRMPPPALLEPVQWSLGTRAGMLALRGYLAVGAIMLLNKAIQRSSG
jgi:amino acid transporter